MVSLFTYFPRAVCGILDLIGNLADLGGKFFYRACLFHGALAQALRA